MSTLANYPNNNQLLARINGPFDCVPTSIQDGLEFLTGKRFSTDDIMNVVYGANYHGMTSAKAFVPFCAEHGVKLFAIDGDPAVLVQDIHRQLQQGHPCIGTEPDVYAPLHPDWSHVISFYREDPGSLTARDPFGAHDVSHDDATWARLLEFREIWAMKRIGGEQSMSGIPQGWRDTNEHDPNGILYSPPDQHGASEVAITGRIRAYILANPWPSGNVSLAQGYHTNQLELSNKELGGGWQQKFRYALLGIPDDGSLKGQVVFEWGVKELDFVLKLLAQEQAQNATLSQQLKSEQEQVASLQAEVAAHNPGLDATAVMNRLQAIEIKTTGFANEIGQLATQEF